MEQIQLLLEQELGRIIVAIVILILLLIIIIIVANVSNKAKKARLENTRTLHRDEFEKAAKKRMELTQTISRKDIQEELASKMKETQKTDKVFDKTMELNLESLRRKQVKEERERIAEIVNDTATKKDDKITSSELKKQKVKEKDIPKAIVEPIKEEKKIEPVKEAIVEPVKEEKKIEPVKEVIVEPVKEEKIEPVKEVIVEPIKEEKIESVKEVIVEPVKEEMIEPAKEVIVEPIKEVEPIVEDVLDFDVKVQDSVDNDDLEMSVADFEEAVLEPIDEDEEFDIDLIGNDYVNDIEEIADVESFDIISDIEPVNNNIFKSENIDIVLGDPEPILTSGASIDVWDDMFGENDSAMSAMSFDDDEIENESTEIFLAIDRIESSVEEEKPSIEFVDVEDQSVYSDNFTFGEEYVKDEVCDEDLGIVSFNFTISASEKLEFDLDENEYNENFLFGDYEAEAEMQDIIDVTMNKAVVNDEQVVIAHTNVSESIVIEELEKKDDESSTNELDNVVLSSSNNEDSLTTQTMDNSESYIVDVQSQLDELDSYETNLLEDYDHTDENYNYNFNSVNVMEEIVEGMHLDEFVDESEDEYFKYIYQFALLDDAITPNKLEVEVGEEELAKSIVSKVKNDYDVLVEKMDEIEDVEETNFDFIDEELDDEFINTSMMTSFTLDSELLDLTNQVIDHPRIIEEIENNSGAYKVDQTRSVVSPVHGASKAVDESEELFEDDQVIEQEELQNFEQENETENLEQETEDFELETENVEQEEINEVENVEDEKAIFELDNVMKDANENEDAVNSFIDMINDKIEDVEAEKPETSEEFLDVLKGLIK